MDEVFVFNFNDVRDLHPICRIVSPTKPHILSCAVRVVQNSRDIVLFLEDANSQEPNRADQRLVHGQVHLDCLPLKQRYLIKTIEIWYM